MLRRLSPALLAGIAVTLALTAVLLVDANGAHALPTEGEPDAPGQQIAPQEEEKEPEANLPFLFAVFIITWAAFFAYLFLTARRQREMQREIEALKTVLAEREASGPAGSGAGEG